MRSPRHTSTHTSGRFSEETIDRFRRRVPGDCRNSRWASCGRSSRRSCSCCLSASRQRLGQPRRPDRQPAAAGRIELEGLVRGDERGRPHPGSRPGRSLLAHGLREPRPLSQRSSANWRRIPKQREHEVAEAALELAEDAATRPGARARGRAARARRLSTWSIAASPSLASARSATARRFRRESATTFSEHPTYVYLLGIEIVTMVIVYSMLSGLERLTPVFAGFFLLILPATQAAVDFMNNLATSLDAAAGAAEIRSVAGHPAGLRDDGGGADAAAQRNAGARPGHGPGDPVSRQSRSEPLLRPDHGLPGLRQAGGRGKDRLVEVCAGTDARC